MINTTTAELHYDGQIHKLGIINGSGGNPGLDISNLRAETGLITYDPGYQNTSAYKSAISSLRTFAMLFGSISAKRYTIIVVSSVP